MADMAEVSATAVLVLTMDWADTVVDLAVESATAVSVATMDWADTVLDMDEASALDTVASEATAEVLACTVKLELDK